MLMEKSVGEPETLLSWFLKLPESEYKQQWADAIRHALESVVEEVKAELHELD